jgi:hypothetical protein
VREIRNEGGEEDGRVWADFAYEWEDDDGDTTTFIRSISCQALDDGPTLVVMHDAPEESRGSRRGERGSAGDLR